MEEIYRAALAGDAPQLVPTYKPGVEPILELDWDTPAATVPTDAGAGGAIQANDHAQHPVGDV
jgi:hypothetical protein